MQITAEGIKRKKSGANRTALIRITVLIIVSIHTRFSGRHALSCFNYYFNPHPFLGDNLTIS